MTALSNNSDVGFQFQVACPLQRSVLNVLRRFVTSVAEEMGFTSEDVMKIEMAVDEACSNAFLHAYEDLPAGEPDGGVQLKLEIGADHLTIQIEDHGKGIDQTRLDNLHSFNTYAQPGKDSYHGLGLLIMQKFMDDVHFAGDDRGTMVTLRKFLRPGDETEAKNRNPQK